MPKKGIKKSDGFRYLVPDCLYVFFDYALTDKHLVCNEIDVKPSYVIHIKDALEDVLSIKLIIVSLAFTVEK